MAGLHLRVLSCYPFSRCWKRCLFFSFVLLKHPAYLEYSVLTVQSRHCHQRILDFYVLPPESITLISPVCQCHLTIEFDETWWCYVSLSHPTSYCPFTVHSTYLYCCYLFPTEITWHSEALTIHVQSVLCILKSSLCLNFSKALGIPL